jgi:hypothetical protein
LNAGSRLFGIYLSLAASVRVSAEPIVWQAERALVLPPKTSELLLLDLIMGKKLRFAALAGLGQFFYQTVICFVFSAKIGK